jgi:hypothetical protein
MSDSFTQKPIIKVEEDLRSIKRMINTMLIDTQSIKSDIAEIKLIIKERDRETPQDFARQGDKGESKKKENIKSGWWIY